MIGTHLWSQQLLEEGRCQGNGAGDLMIVWISGSNVAWSCTFQFCEVLHSVFFLSQLGLDFLFLIMLNNSWHTEEHRSGSWKSSYSTPRSLSLIVSELTTWSKFLTFFCQVLVFQCWWAHDLNPKLPQAIVQLVSLILCNSNCQLPAGNEAVFHCPVPQLYLANFPFEGSLICICELCWI